MSVRDDGDTRAIDIAVQVDASVEEAWEAVSTAEGLESWFPPRARVEPGVGGSVWISWGEGMEGEAPIEAWEPGRLLRWVEEYPEEDPDSGEETVRRVTVEFTVDVRDGSTSVRLVQAGFGKDARWDDYFDGLLTGWRYFMRNLGLYLNRHRGRIRQMIHDRRPPGRTPEEAWLRLMGPEGLDIPRALRGGLVEGEPFTLRLGSEVLNGEAWDVLPNKAFSGIILDLDDAALFVEFEGSSGQWKCGIWLSTYGLEDERVDRLQAGLETAADGAFAG